jgi:hypothetical protein
MCIALWPDSLLSKAGSLPYSASTQDPAALSVCLLDTQAMSLIALSHPLLHALLMILAARRTQRRRNSARKSQERLQAPTYGFCTVESGDSRAGVTDDDGGMAAF